MIQQLPPNPPALAVRWIRWRRSLRPTLSYWMETEVHVYAFSIAANVLLSFFPLLIVIWSICRKLLGWRAAYTTIGFVLEDYFPGDVADHDSMAHFIHANLTSIPGTLQIVSLLLLLFTANGIFEPLEVALNRVWGIGSNRSFLKNQAISLGLIFTCGSLALASTVLTGYNEKVFASWLALAFFKVAALPISVLLLFLIYWLLPNARISARSVLPAALLVGLALEALKYINLLTWPLWRHKLKAEYGPFYYSVTILLWSFLGAMLILAGAEWAARRARPRTAAAAAEPIASPEG